MLKSGKISSAAQEKRETLTGIGYAFDSASRKSGWRWSTASDSSDGSLPDEAAAIEDAWRDAGSKTQIKLQIPEETWMRMGVKEQTEMILDALSDQ